MPTVEAPTRRLDAPEVVWPLLEVLELDEVPDEPDDDDDEPEEPDVPVDEAPAALTEAVYEAAAPRADDEAWAPAPEPSRLA